MSITVQPHFVALKLSTSANETVVLEKTVENREKEMKRQNVGIVSYMGEKCDQWISVGDTVSFYRNASTPVVIPGDGELHLVHEDHILVKF